MVKMSTSLSTVICSRALYTTQNGPHRVAPSLYKRRKNKINSFAGIFIKSMHILFSKHYKNPTIQ